MNRIVSFIKYHFEDKHLSRLILLISISAALIIAINYYTIKIMSSIRAYINGESQYSKGEKDASQNLILYIVTEEDKYYESFIQNLKIPQGDSVARVTLLTHGETEKIKSGFLAGKNHPEDLKDMIWLFNTFSNTSFMKVPIQNWREGDSLVYRKYLIGTKVKQALDRNENSHEHKTSLLKEVLENSNLLTWNEIAFSNSLGNTSRKIGLYLLCFNIVFTLLIAITTQVYASHVYGKIRAKNEELITTNLELDKFVYSVSHDLRAPISSLKGLVSLSKTENDPKVIQQYLELMIKTLDKQESFIKDIINYSRNKKSEIVIEPVDLGKMIDESILEHLYMPGASDINIEKEYEAKTVLTDPRRLSIIINNLISNAFKYYDPNKAEKLVRIKTYLNEGFIFIEFEDNGIGIDEKNKPHIFEMFFVATTDYKGIGIGLYITKETVDKLGGTITLQSTLKQGTRITIKLPNEKLVV
jgi:signal transduction histidine kinase